MNIELDIEHALAAFTIASKRDMPQRLLFGRRQLEAFDRRYGSLASGMVSSGPTRAYNDIPIISTDADDQLDAE
jgi:hypothetical protein